MQSTTFTALKWMMIFYHWFSECEDFFGVANVNNFLQAGSFIFNKISRLFSVWISCVTKIEHLLAVVDRELCTMVFNWDILGHFTYAGWKNLGWCFRVQVPQAVHSPRGYFLYMFLSLFLNPPLLYMLVSIFQVQLVGLSPGEKSNAWSSES